MDKQDGKTMKVKKINQKGQVLIFVSLAFILLGLLAGLGIDLVERRIVFLFDGIKIPDEKD